MSTKTTAINIAKRLSQRSTKRAIAFSALICSACKAEEGAEQVVIPLIEERKTALTDRVLIEVRIAPPASKAEDRRSAELAGLVTALFESGLADLDDVVPRVRGSTVTPAFTPPLSRGVSKWTAELAMAAGPGGELDLQVLLCTEGQICETLLASGTRERAESVTAELIGAAARVLGRTPFAGTSTTWARPQSPDPYAVLLCGRAAATLYRLLPALPAEAIGDRRRDPIERAVFVDPDMPLAQWIAGRRRIALNLPVLAHAAFARASANRPASLVFAADAARALSFAGEYEEAAIAFERVRSQNAGDPRFSLGRAQALLGAGQAERALTELDALPERYRDDPAAVALRVSIADALGTGERREELLLLWQEVAESDPEPVRRRIAQRIDAKRYAEALALTDELALRGAEEEASRIALALSIAVHDLSRAEHEMQMLGMVGELGQLRARAALERDPAAHVPQIATSQDPPTIVISARAIALRGKWSEALAEVDRALAIDPYLPEALALRYQLLSALDRREEATRVLASLERADPAWPKPAPLPAVAP